MKAGKQVQQVKKRLTIRKYMHMQFLRIGFAVSGVVGVLALIGIYEGILLAKEDTRFDLATENKIAIIVGVILAIVVISIVGVDLFLNKIAKQVIRRVKEPIDIMDHAMDELAKGNLDTKIEYQMQDEFVNMMENTNFAMQELKRYVDDISMNLKQISEKDIDLKEVQNYIGDFVEIKDSMIEIISSLNTTLKEMKESFGEVCDGADTLAQSAQSMEMVHSSSPIIFAALWIILEMFLTRYTIAQVKRMKWKNFPEMRCSRYRKAKTRWIILSKRWI